MPLTMPDKFGVKPFTARCCGNPNPSETKQRDGNPYVECFVCGTVFLIQQDSTPYFSVMRTTEQRPEKRRSAF